MLTRTLALVLVAACGVKGDGLTDTSVSSTTTAESDADADADADTDTDTDADTDTGTDSAPEPAVPLAGLGEITGDCGGLMLDTTATAGPALYRSALDFGDALWDAAALSTGGQQILEDGGLGGSSLESEAIAFDLLYRCELASLLKTEAEITYDDPDGKKTDLIVEVDAVRVGVSVTRAYSYPPEEGMSPEAAQSLLDDKLADILVSAENASYEDAWEVSFLSVIAWDDAHADAIVAAWERVDPAVKGDTRVLLTATHGDADDILY